MSKNVNLSFHFLRTAIKRNHSVPSQDYTADDSSNRCFECSKICESSYCRIRLRRLVFLISWKTTGKQMVMYHSELTVLHCSCGTIATCPVFPKKTGDHLFCSMWLILKDPYSRLLFTFGLIRVNPRFITCHDVIDEFRSTAIAFLEHFF